MSYVEGLKCKECGEKYPKKPIYVCEICFGPLEVVYNYEEIRSSLTKDLIESRGKNIWRYAELLPIDNSPSIGKQVGFTPIFKAEYLGKKLNHKNLYVKNDSVCFPTLSFKDRVVSVALSKSVEFGFDTVSCASTGNLANSVSSLAASGKLNSFIFIPHDLEESKVVNSIIYGTNLVGVKGAYDDVNKLCSEVAGKHNWAFVNINMRPYYSEGSKSYAFEVVEQLGWEVPKNFVIPMASGSLLTKVWKAIKELELLGMVEPTESKMFGAQATGCSPISTAVKNEWEIFKPVKANTIAKSLAIGTPADGYYAMNIIRESGGWAEDVSDEEIVEGIKLLAETEGVYTETAGGVTVATAKKLIEQGKISKDESTVICITGNGLKTQDAIISSIKKPDIIEPDMEKFELLYNSL